MRQLAPAIRLAERAVTWLLPELRNLPSFVGADTAQAVRGRLLVRHDVVDLPALVEFAWTVGVPVLLLGSLPKRTKKLDGLAMVCGATPAIVLASRRDSPPWLAFHLAHELGHVFLGHVRADQPPLVDGDLTPVNGNNGDQEEREADEFACEILVGEPRPIVRASPRVGSLSLAYEGRRLSIHDGIDPGVRALFFARATGRWETSERALKRLGLKSGAHRMIGAALRRHLSEDLTETTAQFAALAGAGLPDAA